MTRRCDAIYSHAERILFGEGRCTSDATLRTPGIPSETNEGGPWHYSCVPHSLRNPWREYEPIPEESDA